MKKIEKNNDLKIKRNIKFEIRYLYYLILIIGLTGLYFYTTRNLIYSIFLALIFILLFALIERKYIKYKNNCIKIVECNKFINNFIITLSISNSIKTTYEQIKNSFNDDLKMIDSNSKNLIVDEKIKNLNSYFNLGIYEVFLKLLNQYEFQGGDIIKISQLLLFDTRKMVNLLSEFQINTKRKLIEFSSLWGLTMIILVVIQISMSIFYEQIIKMSFYPLTIFMFFLVFMAFLYLFLNKMFDLNFINFKGDKKYE